MLRRTCLDGLGVRHPQDAMRPVRSRPRSRLALVFVPFTSEDECDVPEVSGPVALDLRALGILA